MGEPKWLKENLSLKLWFYKTCVSKLFGKLGNKRESNTFLGNLLNRPSERGELGSWAPTCLGFCLVPAPCPWR